MTPLQKEKLSALVGADVIWNCRLKGYTTFSIGGMASALVKVKEYELLQRLIDFVGAESLPWRVIGKGSNILVSDDGFPGLIIILSGDFLKITEIAGNGVGEVILRVGAGCGLGRLLSYCTENRLRGLEFIVGIPGTVGGALIMNAGAWGKDIAMVTKCVTVMTGAGFEKLQQGMLDFSYRYWPCFSNRYGGRGIVVAADFSLQRCEGGEVGELCSALLAKRKKSQPPEFKSAGSFFKNPPGDSAGRLIESSGLKGVAVGDAVISEYHANFLINRGKATASDVLKLMKKIQEKVKNDSGVELQPEVHFI